MRQVLRRLFLARRDQPGNLRFNQRHEVFVSAITFMPKRLPNGGMAPISQPGKREINSSSVASRTRRAFRLARIVSGLMTASDHTHEQCPVDIKPHNLDDFVSWHRCLAAISCEV
jgi:hypothetical protein